MGPEMNYRLINWLPAIFAILISAGAYSREDRFAGVEITTHEAAPGIYMLVGMGGNIGVSAGEDGVINSIRALIELADDNTRIIPEHGPLSDRHVCS